MTWRSGLLAPPALLMCTACSGTDVGNPKIDLDAALVQQSFQGLSAEGPSDGVVSEAWVSVERIRLRPAENCDGETEIDLDGPFALDLLAPGIPAELSGLEVTSTRFCRFELAWSPLDTGGADAPAELAGASMLLAGERSDAVPFVVRSERNDGLRLDAVSGAFSIDPERTGLFVGINAAELFAAIPLGDATIDADGQIRIEAGSNEDLLQTFEEAVESATRLFRDGNDDQDLDGDESDPARALAE